MTLPKANAAMKVGTAAATLNIHTEHITERRNVSVDAAAVGGYAAFFIQEVDDFPRRNSMVFIGVFQKKIRHI